MPESEHDTSAIRDEIDTELIEKAEEVGVDVDEVIQTKADEFAAYAPGTVAKFAGGSIRDKIQAEKADDLKGIVVGSRDWTGSQGPRKYALVRSNKENLELSSFQPTATGPDGADVMIPTEGSIVHFQCNWNEEFENYDIEGIEGVKPLDYPELVSQLSSVAQRPADLSMADEGSLVVLEGTVGFVDPIENLEDVSAEGEPEDWQVTEQYSVVKEDNRDPPRQNPHFQITLDREDGSVVRGEIGEQRQGEPFVKVEDLEMMLGDALDRGGPDAQASFLQSGLRGRDVLMVGRVYSFDETTTDDNEHRKYFNLSLTALLEKGLDQAQQTIQETTQPASDPDSDAGASEEDSDDEEAESEAETETDDDGKLEDFEDYDGDGGDEGDDLSALDGVGESKAEGLREEGFTTFEGVAEADLDELTEVDGVGSSLAEKITTSAGTASDRKEEADSADGEVKAGEISAVREDIEDYCDLTNEDIEDLTVGDVNDTLDMGDVPDVVIEMALEDDAPEASDGDSDDPYAAIKSNGQYNCPVGDHFEDEGVCPASAGSVAALSGHMDGDHGDLFDDGAQKWLKETFGA